MLYIEGSRDGVKWTIDHTAEPSNCFGADERVVARQRAADAARYHRFVRITNVAASGRRGPMVAAISQFRAVPGIQWDMWHGPRTQDGS